MSFKKLADVGSKRKQSVSIVKPAKKKKSALDEIIAVCAFLNRSTYFTYCHSFLANRRCPWWHDFRWLFLLILGSSFPQTPVESAALSNNFLNVVVRHSTIVERNRFLAGTPYGEYLLEYRYVQVRIIAKRRQSLVGWFLESFQKTWTFNCWTRVCFIHRGFWRWLFCLAVEISANLFLYMAAHFHNVGCWRCTFVCKRFQNKKLLIEQKYLIFCVCQWSQSETHQLDTVFVSGGRGQKESVAKNWKLAYPGDCGKSYNQKIGREVSQKEGCDYRRARQVNVFAGVFVWRLLVSETLSINQMLTVFFIFRVRLIGLLLLLLYRTNWTQEAGDEM